MGFKPKMEVQCDRCGKTELVDSEGQADPKWPPKWDRLANFGRLKGKWPKDLCDTCIEAFEVFMKGTKN
jgi:hypothetical protein